MKILNVEQMTEVDRLSSSECGVPSLVLMENAGVNLYLALRDRFGEELRRKKIVILCGKGNNGGDGMVLARQLTQRGAAPDVVLLGRAEDVSGDAAVNLDICRKAGLEIREIASEQEWDSTGLRLDAYDVAVDALLGTGLTKPLRGLYSEVASAVNRSGAFVLAVDIPTGMFSDSATGGAESVRADLTVTFTAPKIAHILNADQERLGDLLVVPIGSPPSLLDNPAYCLNLMEATEVARSLPGRPASSHKGSYGHVAVIAGSRGKSGAAALSSTAALRTGSGLVTALLPRAVQDVVAAFKAEIMTEGFADTDQGTFARESLEPLLEWLGSADAAALGPGLTTHPETVETVREIVRRAQLPLVVDADGVNAFAGCPERLGESAGPRVLTPHPGEFSRLIGVPTKEIVADGVALARNFAGKHQVWLVLKGFRTLVAEPGGQVWACPLGNPGMASAGMGDVLTGVLTSMLGWFAAQDRRSPEQATQAVTAGVYLHSLAGDLAADRRGRPALTAGDVVDSLGEAFAEIEKAR